MNVLICVDAVRVQCSMLKLSMISTQFCNIIGLHILRLCAGSEMSLYANSFECMLVPVSQLFSVFAVRNTVVTISLTRLNLPGFRMPLCNCVYVCVCAFQTYKFVCRHSSCRKCVLLFVEFSNSPFFF